MTTGLVILVVEDVEEISLEMHKLLDRRGHRVLHASNAEEAIQVAEGDRPLMILTDMELPTFDAMMGLLREHNDLKNTVVAIIDINGPKINDSSVKVLPDFRALDDLIGATYAASQKVL
jgi:CheY-like chemotaxis protein